MLQETGRLYIAEDVIYPFFLAASIFNFIYIPKTAGTRQRDTTWISLILFCTLKIVGAAITIDTQVNEKDSRNVGLITASTIMLQIALGPLMMATINFAVTANESMPQASSLAKRLLQITHITIIAALSMGTAGAVIQSSPDSYHNSQQGIALSKASSALFMVAWAGATASIAMLWPKRRLMSVSASKIIPATALSLPFILVRTIWTLLAVAHSHPHAPNEPAPPNKYSFYGGEFGYTFGLGFLMELAVVIIYCGTGLLIHRDQMSAAGKAEASRERENELVYSPAETGEPHTENRGHSYA